MAMENPFVNLLRNRHYSSERVSEEITRTFGEDVARVLKGKHG